MSTEMYLVMFGGIIVVLLWFVDVICGLRSLAKLFTSDPPKDGKQD